MSPAVIKSMGLGPRLIVVILVALGVVWSSTVQLVLDSQRERLIEAEEYVGRTIAKSVAAGALEPLLLRDYPKLDTLAQVVVDEDPTIVACRVQRADGTTIVDISGGASRKTMEFREIVSVEGDVIGEVMVTLGSERVDALIVSARRQLMLQTAFMGCVLAVLVSFLLRNMVGRPIQLLAGQVSQLTSTDMSSAVHLECGGELGMLAERIEAMRAETQATRQKQVQQTEKLARALATAKQANDAKTAFIAGMSHEIRTPLVGVLGASSLLEQEDLLESQRELVDTIQASGETLLVQLNDILDYAKAAAGMLEVQLAPTDPTLVLEQAVAVIGGQAGEQGLSIVASCAPLPPMKVMADHGRLRQILLNLLGNALKFTEVGSVSIQISNEVDWVRFEIRDTGPGLSLDPESLFEAFRQGPAGGQSRVRGTGLGLAICRELTTRMGGSIGAENLEVGGALFWLELPAADSMASSPPPIWEGSIGLSIENEQVRAGVRAQLIAWGINPLENADHFGSEVTLLTDSSGEVEHGGTVVRLGNIVSPGRLRSALTPATTLPGVKEKDAPNEAPVRPINILAADDNSVNRQVLSAMLSRLGHKVVVVDDGPEAVEMFREGAFDLVLLDYHMMEMDGAEAATQMRRTEEEEGRRRVSIVAVSAAVGLTEREACLESGMDDFLSKPFQFAELDQLIRRYAPISVEAA